MPLSNIRATPENPTVARTSPKTVPKINIRISSLSVCVDVFIILFFFQRVKKKFTQICLFNYACAWNIPLKVVVFCLDLILGILITLLEYVVPSESAHIMLVDAVLAVAQSTFSCVKSIP